MHFAISLLDGVLSPQPLISVPTPTRRRWLRFSMRSLFVVTTVVACFFGWAANERRMSEHERQTGKKLQELGCQVQYIHPYRKQGWRYKLAREVLGEGIVRISGVSSIDSAEHISLLVGLNHLEEIYIRSETVNDLTPLAELLNVKKLRLDNTSVRDFTPLAGFKNLEELYPLWHRSQRRTTQIPAASSP